MSRSSSTQTYNAALWRAMVGAVVLLWPLGATAQVDGNDADEGLPPRQLEVSAEAMAQPTAPSLAEEIAPSQQHREAPVEEVPARRGGGLPSADELFEQDELSPPPHTREEPSVEELEADVRAQREATQRGSETPTQPSAATPPVISPTPATPDAASAIAAAGLERFIQLFDGSSRAEFTRGYTLSPYVEDARWFEATALMQRGSCKEALGKARDVVSAADAPAAIRYAMARMQLCAGEKREGGALLRELSKQADAVGALARGALGLEPLAAQTQHEDEESATLSALLREVKARAARGEQAGAMEDLAALRMATRSGWSWYRVRLTEAELLEGAKDVERASQVWLSIYLRTRHWKSGQKIEEMIAAFERRHGVEVLRLEDQLDRVRELVARGRYKEAQQASDALSKKLKLKGEESAGWAGWRKGLMAERDKKREEAVAHFEKAAAQIKTPQVRLRLYWGWARALRRLDRDREAVALYDRICHEFPMEELCAEGMYEGGRLLQYLGEHASASARFEGLVGLFPDHASVPDALWRGAFSSYLKGDYAAMDAPLEQLRDYYGEERDESELSLGLKAQYWLGVAALKRGDRLRAASELNRALDRGPLTWYGRLAAQRLEAMGLKPMWMAPVRQMGMAELRRLDDVHVPRDPRLERAVELIRAGLYEEARSEVTRQLSQYPQPEGAERLLASLHLALGRPDLGHWTMKRHLHESWPTPQTLRDWGTAFPLDYMEHAHGWGVKYGVDPFLVQAIIRQESGFRETVKSPAGATGLMQLMPGTASYTARVFLEDEGESNYKARDLVKPERNIQLGTMYIRMHIAHTSDTVALALAGYNAGGAPLKRWVTQYGDREMDAWVESITYQEARGYVRKVMTSYITYSWLYGEGELPRIGMDVPKTLRKWGEVPEVRASKAGEPLSMHWVEEEAR